MYVNIDTNPFIIINKDDKLTISFIAKKVYPFMELTIQPIYEGASISYTSSANIELFMNENNFWEITVPTDNLLNETSYMGILTGLDEELGREECARICMSIR